MALANVAIITNSGCADGSWLQPSASSELDAIYATVLSGTTFGGTPFPVAMQMKHRRLFVAIVDIDSAEHDSVVVQGGKGFRPNRSRFSCVKVHVLAAAGLNSSGPTPKLPVFRWKVAKRKFSLPKGNRPPGSNYVCGPYLAIGVYEPDSLALAKVRLWPVWYSKEHNRMSIVRSDLERAGAAAIADNNAVGFTLVNRRHLLLLQEGLGIGRVGDIATYQYQPDYILMPTPNYPATLAELFGLLAMKRYDASATSKIEAGEANRHILFSYFDGARTKRRYISG